MIVVISGTRENLTVDSIGRLMDVLGKVNSLFHVVNWRWGDCPTGVDGTVESLFKQGHSAFWSGSVATPKRVFKADWDALGKKAGPERNAAMIYGGGILMDEPRPRADLLLAFPAYGKPNKGTRNAIAHAGNAYVDTWVTYLNRGAS